MKFFCVLIIFFSCIALPVVQGKGSFGSSRAVGGGYFRSAKGGYYSQRYRYRSSYLYWRTGYYYAGSSQRVPNVRIQTHLSVDQEKDLQCRRSVIVDNISTNFGSSMNYNSTQYCYKELYSQRDDPGNVPFDTLMLDRYRVNISLSGYPTIDFRVYPDKDIDVPSVNLTYRLRRLYIANDTSSAAANVVSEIDLSTMVWQPCTLASCRSSGTSSFGRPSSRLLDNDRIFFSSVYANWTSFRIDLTFWLTNDFCEDNSYEHVLLLPSQLKIDVQITAIAGSVVSSTLLATPHYFGLEGLVVNPTAGPGSAYVPVKILDARQPLEYDPRSMNRIEMGTFTDQQNRLGGLLSWFTSVDRLYLCFSPANESCAQFETWENTTIVCSSTNTNPPAYCQNNLMRAGQSARFVNWIFRRPISSSYSATLQSHFGFLDPSMQLQLESSSPPISVLCTVLVILISLWVM